MIISLKILRNTKVYNLYYNQDGRTFGEGIKQIPGYKCNLPYDALEKLRTEFWENKRTRPWLVLKTCCEADDCKLYFKI
jgi:hypothetical protein